MKKILLLFIFVLVVGFFCSWFNNNPGLIVSELFKNKADFSGDLTYQINFFGVVPVGKVVFIKESLKDLGGRSVYLLSARAKVSKLVSYFYPATASLDSYVDRQDLTPALFVQKVSLNGKDDVVKEIKYDQENKVMQIGQVKREIISNTQDPLSAIFNLRKMDLEKVRNFEFNINTNQKNYTMLGSVVPQELRINNKIYRIFVIKTAISRRDKNPYHKSAVDMVMLKSKENIPIIIRVFASGALLNIKLVGAK